MSNVNACLVTSVQNILKDLSSQITMPLLYNKV